MVLTCTAALLLPTGCSVPGPAGPQPVTPALSPSVAPTPAPDAAAPVATGGPTQYPAPRPSATAQGGATPVVDGWSTVHSTQRAALYDVPPTWKVNSEDTIVGFQTKSGQLLTAASGSASVGENACGQYTSLATSAVKHSTSSDLARASTLEAQQWADAAFLDSEDHRPTLQTGEPETITTVTGRKAVVVKVSATAASSIGNCGPHGVAYAVSATGFTGRLGPTAILVVVAGTDFAAAVPDGRIRQILTTLRPDS